MNNLYNYLPEVDHQELMYLESILKDMDEKKLHSFAAIYRGRRRDPQVIMLVTLLGFVGFAGVQRFMTNQIGMGILFFFTAGLCFIGTIVDLVNYRSLALEYNQQMARESLMIIKSMN